MNQDELFSVVTYTQCDLVRNEEEWSWFVSREIEGQSCSVDNVDRGLMKLTNRAYDKNSQKNSILIVFSP